MVDMCSIDWWEGCAVSIGGRHARYRPFYYVAEEVSSAPVRKASLSARSRLMNVTSDEEDEEAVELRLPVEGNDSEPAREETADEEEPEEHEGHAEGDVVDDYHAVEGLRVQPPVGQQPDPAAPLVEQEGALHLLYLLIILAIFYIN